MQHFGERMAAEGSDLRQQLVHSDANESNVLVHIGIGGGWEVAGLIDFGDCCHQARIRMEVELRRGTALCSPQQLLSHPWPHCQTSLHQVLANEPAITAVYMALEHLRLGGAAPLDAIRSVLAGYQAQMPLLPPERRVLRTLMLGRLAMSLGLGVKAALEEPENADYVLRTQHDGWTLLRLLCGMSDDAFAASAGLV